MKRLAGLTALALVIGNTSGCGWLWGPEGYFRDRGTDYLGARETPPMQLPEGVHSKPLDPLLPIPLNVATTHEKEGSTRFRVRSRWPIPARSATTACSVAATAAG